MFVLYFISYSFALQKSDFEIRGEECQNLYEKNNQKLILNEDECVNIHKYDVSLSEKYMFVTYNYTEQLSLKYSVIYSLPDFEPILNFDPTTDKTLEYQLWKGSWYWIQGDYLMLRYGCGSPCYDVRIFSVDGEEHQFIEEHGYFYTLFEDKRHVLVTWLDHGRFPIHIYDLLKQKKIFTVESEYFHDIQNYEAILSGKSTQIFAPYTKIYPEDYDDPNSKILEEERIMFLQFQYEE